MIVSPMILCRNIEHVDFHTFFSFRLSLRDELHKGGYVRCGRSAVRIRGRRTSGQVHPLDCYIIFQYVTSSTFLSLVLTPKSARI